MAKAGILKLFFKKYTPVQLENIHIVMKDKESSKIVKFIIPVPGVFAIGLK